jgi:hypothetical protein
VFCANSSCEMFTEQRGFQCILVKGIILSRTRALCFAWLGFFHNRTILSSIYADRDVNRTNTAPSDYYYYYSKIHSPFTYIFAFAFCSYIVYRTRRINGGCAVPHRGSIRKTTIIVVIFTIIILEIISLMMANKVRIMHFIGTSIPDTSLLMDANLSISVTKESQQQQQQPTFELEWQNISFQHLDKYFNKFEMGSLGVNMDVFRDIQKQKESFFSDHNHTTKELLFHKSLRECNSKNLPETCCIGSISNGGGIFWNPDTCLPIFANVNKLGANYFRRLVPKGTKDASTIRYHTMADVMEILGHNRTLLFVGDSVMGQLAQDAALCSWARNTESLQEEGYPKVAEILKERNLNETEVRWRYKASWFGWDIDTSKGARAGIRYLKAYRPEHDFSNILYWSDHFQPDVVVLNFGLHYLMEERYIYTKMIRNFLEKFRTYALSKPLFFRETSAQHLATDGGEWNTQPAPDWNITAGLRTCQPLRFVERSENVNLDLWYYDENDPYEEDSSLFSPTIKKWRDKIVVREALAQGYTIKRVDEYFLKDDRETDSVSKTTCKFFDNNDTERSPILFIIPFYDLTEDLWDGHDYTEKEGCEPTHLCSSPFFWEHIYDRIYGILKQSKPFCSS